MNLYKVLAVFAACLSVVALLAVLLAGNGGGGTLIRETKTNVISVSGSADVLTVPDQIVITLGIESRNRDIALAKDESDQKTALVLEVAKKYKIDARNIQMDYMDVKPCDMTVKSSYTSYDNIPPANLGYAVRKRVVVTIKDLSTFETFLTDVINKGVEYIQGVSFNTSELRKYKDMARELAVKAAREKADAMAAALGQKAGKAVKITEQQEYYWSWYDSWYWGWYGGSSVSSSNVSQNVISSGQAQSGDAAVPGQIKIKASVSIEFELN